MVTDPGSVLGTVAYMARRVLAENGMETILTLTHLEHVARLIDDVDAEIVELLARRTHLARRASRIKTAHGAEIRDPRRVPLVPRSGPT